MDKHKSRYRPKEVVVHGVKMEGKKHYLIERVAYDILLFSAINISLALMLVIHHH